MPTSADFSTMSKSNLDAMRDSNYFNRKGVSGVYEALNPKAPVVTGSFLDDEEAERKGFLDAFLEGMQSYNPEKNKTESDKLFDSMAARRSGSGGSFEQFGNLGLYTPDNSARENAILQQNQINAQQAAQAKQNKTNTGRMAGTAIGSVVGGPVGGAIGGFIGGLFCDIRLKEDIAPLCVSEVNDVLSECAFFVKNLNECS